MVYFKFWKSLNPGFLKCPPDPSPENPEISTEVTIFGWRGRPTRRSQGKTIPLKISRLQFWSSFEHSRADYLSNNIKTNSTFTPPPLPSPFVSGGQIRVLTPDLLRGSGRDSSLLISRGFKFAGYISKSYRVCSIPVIPQIAKKTSRNRIIDIITDNRVLGMNGKSIKKI